MTGQSSVLVAGEEGPTALSATPARTDVAASAPRPTLLRRLRQAAEQWSLVVAFALTIAVFSAAQPQSFATWDNFRSILDQAAVLVVLGSGLTVVLVLREFDLSIGAIPGAASAASVVLLSHHHLATGFAVAAAVGLGVGIGLTSGFCVAYLGVPSFIATLAVGSLAGGLELAITTTTIFEGIPHTYVQIAEGRLLGLPLAVVIAAAFGAAVAVLLRLSVYGRQATAIGDNALAAHLAGVPTQRIRLIGFAISGLGGGLAGVLLSARAASYYPNAGVGLLLPAYAAAFLGLALGRGWRFNILGTCLGVLFLGTVTTGLAILNQPSWLASVVQGVVLLAAVVALMTRDAAPR